MFYGLIIIKHRPKGNNDDGDDRVRHGRPAWVYSLCHTQIRRFPWPRSSKRACNAGIGTGREVGLEPECREIRKTGSKKVKFWRWVLSSSLFYSPRFHLC